MAMRKTKAEKWSDFEGMALEMEQIKDEVKILDDRRKELQDAMLTMLDNSGQTSHTFIHNGKQRKVQRIQSSSMVIDEPRLRKRLGSVLWNKVSTRTLDKRKLDAHLASKEVKASIVAECAETKENNPYIKIT